MTTGFTADDLSAHSDFLQRLAASLLRDPEGAHDVAQDALVAALEHPPERRNELRGWLATVTRNLARNRVRSERNRERREASAARAEAQGDVHAIAQRMEVQRLVCEAVLALDEPRRVAIYLRYFEGLTPDEIALRVGAPVKTVQSRLNRGLAELRERLDRHFGGERRRWTSALVPLVRRSSVAASAGGVGALAWLGAAAVLASLATWVALRGAAAPPVEPVALGAASASAAPSPAAAALVSAPVQPARASLTAPPLETALVVHLRWESDGSPAVAVGLDLACANEPAPRELRVRGVTDAAGNAHFESLAPGPVSLHLDRCAHFEAVAVAGETRELEFLVPRGEDVRGRVLTADGAPLAGATLWGEDIRALYPDPWPLGVSASDGSFRLREPAALLRICARASGHLPSSSARVMDLARAADGTRTLELVVGDGGQPLEGRVLAPDGSPVPDAVVWIGSKSSLGTIDAAGQMREAPGAERVLTDADGRFRSLAHLGAGVHDVVALAPGFPAWIGDVESDGVAQLAPVEIRLLAPATVRGSVTTPDGAPVAGAELTLVERGETLRIGGQTSVIDPRHAPPLRARTDASGAFELSWIGRETRLTAVAPAPGLGRAEATLRLAPGETSTAQLVLESIASIAGRVVDGEGHALVGRKVEGLPNTRGYPLPTAVTDAEGRFTLPAPAPCSYRVSVLTELGAPCTGAMAEPGTSTLELVVADPAPDSSRVHGLLFEADGRVPADAQALLFDLEKQCGYLMAPAPTTGRFESVAVPAGRYRLQAQRGLRVVAVGESFELASAQDRDCGALSIPVAGELELTTSGGGEFAWAMLEREGFGRVSMVEENGRLQARELAPGSWTLRAQSPERFAAERTIEIRAGERASLTVDFEPGASVTFVLRADDETRFASDVTLEARDATGRLLTRQVFEHGALGWHAEQSLSLPLGALSVEATTTTGKRDSASLEVVEPFQRVELALH